MATKSFDQILITYKKLRPFFLLFGSIYLASTDYPEITIVTNTIRFPGKMDSLMNYYLSGNLITFHKINRFVLRELSFRSRLSTSF